MKHGRDFILVDAAEPAAQLLEACPFLAGHPGIDFANGPTCVFGDVARLLQGGQLDDEQSLEVFAFFNAFADQAGPGEREVLATGALESFNDDVASQRLGRRHLRGRALALLEEMRICNGQPDYGGEA